MAKTREDDLKRYRQRLGDLVDEPKRMLPPIEGYQNKPLVPLEEAVKPLIKQVPKVQEQASTAKNLCKKDSQHGLTIEESAAIYLYTMEAFPKEASVYHVLNEKLRSEDRSVLKDWFLYLKLILTGLLKMPSSNQTVFRGVPEDLSKDYDKGKSRVWWGFSSTSTSREVVKAFCEGKPARTVFEIACYSGKDIAAYSHFADEKEILLIAATQLQVVSNVTDASGETIIQLKETEPQFPLIHKGQAAKAPKTAPFHQQKVSTSHNSSAQTPKIQQPQSAHLLAGLGPDQRNPETCARLDRIPPRSKAVIEGESMNRETMRYTVEQVLVKKQCPVLELHNVQLSPESMEELGRGIRGSSALQEVNLRGNHLSNEHLFSLVGELATPQTREVEESGCCGFTTKREVDCGQIKILNLGNNNIDDAGVKHLVSLLQLKRTLIELHLEETQIGDDGVEQLAKTLSHSSASLQKLYLHKNRRITDRGVMHLAPMLNKNQSLTTLWLHDCSLTDAGKLLLTDATKAKKGFYANIQRVA